MSEASLWFGDAAKALTSGVLELFWVSVQTGNEGGTRSNLQPVATFCHELLKNFALTSPIKSPRKSAASDSPFCFSSSNHPSPNSTHQNVSLINSSLSKANKQNPHFNK